MNRYKLSSFSVVLVLSSILFSHNSYAISCGDSISSDLVLEEDLDCSGSGAYTAMEIAATGITIDLNGFTLSGDTTLSGISAFGFDKLTVKNGSIQGFWSGLNTNGSDNLKVQNVTFYNTGSGVIVSGGNGAVIENNDFIETSSYAVDVSVRTAGDSSSNNQIRNNEFFRTTSAVHICGDKALNNQITDNLIWKTQDYAIHLNRADRNTIERNRILEVGDVPAIRLNDSSYNVIKGNAVMGGEHSAISVLSQAGSPCFESGYAFSGKNQITENRIWDFVTGIIMGQGVGSVHNVTGNFVSNNEFNDAETGVFLNTDTSSNYGKGNIYNRTATEVVDHGENNSL